MDRSDDFWIRLKGVGNGRFSGKVALRVDQCPGTEVVWIEVFGSESDVGGERVILHEGDSDGTAPSKGSDIALKPGRALEWCRSAISSEETAGLAHALHWVVSAKVDALKSILLGISASPRYV